MQCCSNRLHLDDHAVLCDFQVLRRVRKHRASESTRMSKNCIISYLKLCRLSISTTWYRRPRRCRRGIWNTLWEPHSESLQSNCLPWSKFLHPIESFRVKFIYQVMYSVIRSSLKGNVYLRLIVGRLKSNVVVYPVEWVVRLQCDISYKLSSISRIV